MAQINIVTGYTGEAHVKSEDDALLNRFLLGLNSAIITMDESDTSSSITIDCDVLMNGRLIRTDTAQTFQYSPPASGYFRSDVIYICYCKDRQTGIESAYLDYAEGTPSSTFPAPDPTRNTHNGTAVSNFDLFFVNWDNSQTPTVQAVWGVEEIPYEDSQYFVYRVYNAGNPDNTNIGAIDTYRIPIHKGVSLVVGHGTDFDSAGEWSLQSGKTYGFEIRRGNADFPRTVLGGGVQISVGDWNSQQTYTSVAQDRIRIGIKPSINVSSSSLQINFWYLDTTDFS